MREPKNAKKETLEEYLERGGEVVRVQSGVAQHYEMNERRLPSGKAYKPNLEELDKWTDRAAEGK